MKVNMFLKRLEEQAHPGRQHAKQRVQRQPSRARTVLSVGALTAVVIAGVWGYWAYGQPRADNGGAFPPTANVAAVNNNSATVALSNVNISAKFADTDDDGLYDETEALYGTDPASADTDRDGFSDATEVANGFEPRNPAVGIRMVDRALVDRLISTVQNLQIMSSGVSSADRERYYLVFDGTATSYYAADGSLRAQCVPADEPVGDCETLPNTLHTDFSRTFSDGAAADSYHVPF